MEFVYQGQTPNVKLKLCHWVVGSETLSGCIQLKVILVASAKIFQGNTMSVIGILE